MAIHVQDEEADWLIRDFARRRGVGITAAIKLAVREASLGEKQGFEEFKARLRPIVEELNKVQVRDTRSHKQIMDDHWGE